MLLDRVNVLVLLAKVAVSVDTTLLIPYNLAYLSGVSYFTPTAVGSIRAKLYDPESSGACSSDGTCFVNTMPLFPSGSSEQLPKLATTAPSPVVQKRLAALALDKPLTSAGRIDRMRLLLQSPYRIYSYWNYARDPFATLRRVFTRMADDYRLALRLVDVESKAESFQLVDAAGNWWFDVQPARRYQAHLGLFALNRPFIRLLSSNTVHTPRVSVSTHVDSTAAFQVSMDEFARVLSETGFAPDRIGITLEAADARRYEDGATAIWIQALQNQQLDLTSDEQIEMRQLMAILAASNPLDRLRLEVSPRLYAWLEDLRAKLVAQGITLDALSLLNILRSLFNLALDEDLPDARQSAMQAGAAGVRWGASGAHRPPEVRRVWMPSMTAGVRESGES